MIDRKRATALVNQLCLKSEQLLIRRSSDVDKLVMIQHESHPEIMRYILTIGSQAETAAGVEKMLLEWTGIEDTWLSFSVINCTENSQEEPIIGFVFLNVISFQEGVVEIGYRLHPDHQGYGFGYAAVQLFLQWIETELQPDRYIAYCVCENKPSWRLLEKLGFAREKEILDGVEINGQTYAEYLYAKPYDL